MCQGLGLHVTRVGSILRVTDCGPFSIVFCTQNATLERGQEEKCRFAWAGRKKENSRNMAVGVGFYAFLGQTNVAVGLNGYIVVFIDLAKIDPIRKPDPNLPESFGF